MKRHLSWLLAVPLLLSAPTATAGGKGRAHPRSVPTARNPAGQGVAAPSAVRPGATDDLLFGKPVHYQNLSLVPVMTRHQGPFQKYALLESALEAKTLAVRELNGQSDEAQVSAVEVRNKGQLPVYLLGGEMILGGKQDRIIQSDTVVPPASRWTKVAVFCVEQGRWQGQNMKFAAGKALAHVALRQAALSGEQGKVWAEVAAKNAQHGTTSATDTYRRTIQNEKVRRQIAPYREQIARQLPGDKQLAGLIFAINGKIRVADLFGNPVLFGDVRDKLLSAYILEALGQEVDRDAAPVSADAAKGWIGKARAAKKVPQPSSGRSQNYKLENPYTIGGETVDKASGQKVRETYMNK